MSHVKKLLIVLFFLTVACSSSGPKTTVNNMLNAIKESDAEKVLECIEPEEVALFEKLTTMFNESLEEADIPMDDIKSILNSYGVGDDFSSFDYEYKVGKVKYNDDKTIARVEYTVNGEEGYYNLVEIDGEWYISLF